jgi:Fur family ferric uptake transcriptional regulator
MDVLCRVLLDDGTLRYRWSRRGHHHHLICTECGAVQDFTACDVSDLVQGLTRRLNFAVDSHWLEVYGRCANHAGNRHQATGNREPAAAGAS